MSVRLSFVVVFLTPFIASCGGSDSATPAAPSPPPAPTANRMAISGPDAIRAGFASAYTAAATLSDGTTQAVTPTWTSSNESIGTVDANGRLNGVSHGSISLGASYQGVSGTKTVNVVNDYGGVWSGSYAIRACDQSGAFAAVRWCQELGGIGAILPISMQLSQTGNDQRQVAGVLALGSLAGNIAGSVTTDGALNLGGSFTVTSGGLPFQFTFGGWETRLIGPGQMRGRWAHNLTAVGIPGNAYQENELVTMAQTSTTATTSPAPSAYTLTWPELFSKMRLP